MLRAIRGRLYSQKPPLSYSAAGDVDPQHADDETTGSEQDVETGFVTGAEHPIPEASGAGDALHGKMSHARCCTPAEHPQAD
ncbi:MAG: hypothetical protein PHF57_02095, partial [Methanoregula sp.]|nr:hypothetical protein [Methanoregula sp.]